jgi:hypothetical protein
MPAPASTTGGSGQRRGAKATHPEQHAQAAADAHVQCADDGQAFGCAVVGGDAAEEHQRERRSGQSGHDVHGGESDETENARGSFCGGGRDGPAGERAFRAVAAVFGEVEEIVHHEARAVEPKRGEDGEGGARIERGDPALHRSAGEQKARERIAGDGQEIGSTEKLEPVAHGRS